jgi:type IV secretory pathway VirB10-like protein
MPDNHPNSPEIPQVTDRRRKIEGLLPKNAQARVLGGIALVMVVIIMLSGRNAPKERPTSMPSPTASAVNANQERIQAYKAQIEDQSRKLAAEESQLVQTKQTLGISGTAVTPMDAAQVSRNPPLSAGSGYSREGVAENWVERDRQKREYQGLFASNIALTYRRSAAPNPLETAAPASAAAAVAEDTDDEAVTHPQERRHDSEQAQGKKYRLFEGTVIETVLTNRLDASLSGPVNCLLTTNVYSHDHQRLLVPQGTRLLGEVRKLESMGEQRVAVFFHRMIMPDGYSVSLDKFQGLNQVGETGLRDQVNHHYLQIFGVSLAIGALAGLSQANTRYGADTSALDAYRQGVSTSLSQSSLHILDKFLNVLPTFSIREGHRVKVYLSGDLTLPAYDQHEIPSDL